eukprot:UN12264
MCTLCRLLKPLHIKTPSFKGKFGVAPGVFFLRFQGLKSIIWAQKNWTYLT